MIGVQQIDRVVEVCEESLKGHVVRVMGEKKEKREEGETGGGGRKRKVKLGGAPLSLPKIRKNRLVEILPISTGCLNQCTYCKVSKKTRQKTRERERESERERERGKIKSATKQRERMSDREKMPCS